MKILNRAIGKEHPCYIIAEVSCNHEGDKEEAKRIIKAAADGGADAVKIQTYTADTISRNFQTKPEGTIWEHLDLHALYSKAETPWEWSKDLRDYAQDLGLHFFSSPFDETAVDFLVNDIEVPCLKIASFEVVDTKLLEKCAKTGLPIIMSNGMTDFLEMDEAIRTLQNAGCTDLAVLHCNSGYPAAFDEANLKTMQAIAGIYKLPVGVSDHTLFADHENYKQPMAHITPVQAVKMGASIVEIHLTTDRDAARALFDKNEGGFDWPFSMNPDEFKLMVDMIREYEQTGNVKFANSEQQKMAEAAIGEVCFTPTTKEQESKKLDLLYGSPKILKKVKFLNSLPKIKKTEISILFVPVADYTSGLPI